MDDVIHKVRDALATGEIHQDDLTTRRLCAFVGKTTSVVYHRWGSLDAFLFAVSQSGFELLFERLMAAELKGGHLRELAADFVAFGIDHPALYGVMFERPYDWARLREAGAFSGRLPGLVLWRAIVDKLRALGSTDPDLDARLLQATLHGLVSLANSGRANVDALTESDRAIALRGAARIVDRLTTAP